MVTQTQAPDPSQTRTIRIPATEIIPQVQPAVSIGELLRFVVRQNDGGAGLLYMRGLLIPATLPPELAPGDKVLAKVTTQGESLVLKLLERQPASLTAPTGPAGAASALEVRLKDFLRAAGPLGFTPPPPLELPASSLAGTAAGETIAAVLDAVPSANELLDAGGALKQLLASATGEVAESLQESARLLRNLSPAQSDPLMRFLVHLRAHLSEVLARDAAVPAAPRELGALIQSVQQEVTDAARRARTGDKRSFLLEQVLMDLKTAEGDPAVQRAKLSEAERRIAAILPGTAQLPAHTDPHAQSEIGRLANRLEQMASAQQQLSQLNPLMQALGEPALILFPFISQGLLTHSEVTVESRTGKKEKGENGRSGRGKSTPFHRVQVSVPLPTIGSVDVDMAHRDDEILVRFTVADPEVGAFLLDQLEHLASILREQSFTKAELVAQVGPVGERAPAWTAELRASTSIFA